MHFSHLQKLHMANFTAKLCSFIDLHSTVATNTGGANLSCGLAVDNLTLVTKENPNGDVLYYNCFREKKKRLNTRAQPLITSDLNVGSYH